MCMHLYFWDLAILGNSIIFVLSYILCNAGMKDEGEECNSAGINNFISGARHYSSQKERRFLFLRDLLDRKDDSCTIAHDFLRVPPFSSRPHASLTSSPRPLIPVEVLRRSRFPSFFFLFFFLLDEFNSCRHSVRGRTFNLPRLLPTSGSIRISISMHRHPRKHSFSSFQYHAPPASFLFVATG